MSDIGYVIIFSLIGGVVSLLGGLLLLTRQVPTVKLARYVTPFAAGALLAAVFLDLLQEGTHIAQAETVMTAALVGILLFFFAERFLHWFHHHHQHQNADPSKSLIIAGDILHNALDGVAIAAAFLVSVPTGIVTTLAIAAHEIPQEIGDFGLLLSKGMAKRKVLIVNVLSALATTVAAVGTYLVGSQEALPLGALFGLSAGFLLYIALSDIIPEIHERSAKAKLFDWQPIMLLLGVIVVGLAISLAHKYVEAEDEHADEAESSIHSDPDQSVVCIQIYPSPPECDSALSPKQRAVDAACERAIQEVTQPGQGISKDAAICNGTLTPEL